MEYLTEETLRDYLACCKIGDWIHNKKIPDTKVLWRPDYRNEELKLLVEFDGPLHYTRASVILKDYEKNDFFGSLGYRIVRIPYFVQVCPELASFVFSASIGREQTIPIMKQWKQTYPHGFVDEKAIRPCDFCTLGVKRFEDFVSCNRFLFGEDILNQMFSLNEKDELIFSYPLQFANSRG